MFRQERVMTKEVYNRYKSTYDNYSYNVIYIYEFVYTNKTTFSWNRLPVPIIIFSI